MDNFFYFNYLYTDKDSLDIENMIAGISMSWSNKWTLFDQDSQKKQFEKAKTFYRQKKYKKAIRFCKRLLKEDATHIESYYVVSYSYLKMNKFKDALPYLLLIYEKTGDKKIEMLLEDLYYTDSWSL